MVVGAVTALLLLHLHLQLQSASVAEASRRTLGLSWRVTVFAGPGPGLAAPTPRPFRLKPPEAELVHMKGDLTDRKRTCASTLIWEPSLIDCLALIPFATIPKSEHPQ